MDPNQAKILLRQRQEDEWAIAAFKEFRVSVEDILRIANYEQRSELWKLARKWRLTGSNFAAAAGHNPYQSPEGLAREMMWGSFQGNEATAWGNAHEDTACSMYEAYMRQMYPDFTVSHSGLQVIPDFPFIGVSPDGLCSYWDDEQGKRVNFLLEIKCPFRWKTDCFYFGHVPVYYYDQIQGIAGFLNLEFCDFVVWTPAGMEINRVRFDPDYFSTVLRPALLTWYTTLFYPALCGWREGKIEPPNLTETLTVTL